MDLGQLGLREKLIEELYAKELFNINLFGWKIPVADTVVVMWIIMAFLIITAFLLTRQMKPVPRGKQNLVEVIVGFFNSFSRDVVGHHWRVFAPYVGTVALFLAFANTISLFNFIPGGDYLYKVTGLNFFQHIPDNFLKPPTRNINIPASLAVLTMGVCIFEGIAIKKPKNWLRSFFEPSPIVFPFKVFDYFIRPASLTLRLFGNILGAFIVMELLYLTLPALLPAPLSIYFDIFDGFLQAYIFVFLSLFYMAEAVE
ncbi:MAG: F0F1 ATP synthase subunit A [Dethiobacteria bacterium]